MEITPSQISCEFCKKTFNSQKLLVLHRTRAKYCLDLQGKEQTKFKCELCNKILSSKKRLESHSECCKEKIPLEQKLRKEIEDDIKDNLEKKWERNIKDKQNNKLKKQYEEQIKIRDEKIKYQEETIRKLELNIEKLQDTISSIAHKNTTTTNNNVVINSNQYLNLTKENVGEIIEKHLTKDVVGQGAVGLANMVSTKLLKAEDGLIKYKCVDPSRQMFGYHNSEGDFIKDVKASKLTSALVQSGNLDRKARESGEELWTKDDGEIDYERFHIFQPKVSEIINLQNDNTKFRSALTTMMA